MLKEVRWRWVLPIGQVLFAAFLLYLGDLQYRSDFPETIYGGGAVGWDVRAVWDYTPSAHTFLICINFPAVVLVAPLLGIVPAADHLLRRGILLLGIFVFWRWLGSRLDRRYGNLPRLGRVTGRLALTLWILGAAGSVFFFGIGVWAVVDILKGKSGVELLFPAAILGWAMFFLFHFRRRLRCYYQSNPARHSEDSKA